MGVRQCLLKAGSWSQHLQPHRGGSTVGGGSPRYGQCLSFLFFGLALLLVSQPVGVYHLTHSITSAVGSLLPKVSHLILCFHSGRREWQSQALLPEEHISAFPAQQRQRKLFPNFFLHKPWHATTRFLGKGGGPRPPLYFLKGAFLRKGGGPKFFSSVHRSIAAKLILHHIDTFVMQVSWIGSKQSNEIIIFIMITKLIACY